MSSSTPPIIAFELGVGEFRIVTPEAVYQIKVSPELVEASQGLPPAEGRAEAGSGDEPAFFREISEELFDKVGRLARRLSVSVEELPNQLDEPDLDQTDQQLENAKGQLEEVVKITEKASMTIMDTADHIQTDMDQLKSQLDILQRLDLMAEPGPAPIEPPDGETPLVTIADRPPTDPEFSAKLEELKDFIDKLLAEAGPVAATAAAAPVPAPEPEPAPQPAPEPAPAAPPQIITVTTFNVDVIFQTLYEFCTNESVKDHIKIMREAQSTAFNTQEVAEALSELSRTLEKEDGAYNIPIPAILKTLYAATASEEFRTTLKKMNQTAASIFLDNVLPIEGETQEIELPAAAPEPAPAAPPPAPEPNPEPQPIIPAESQEQSGRFCSLADLQTLQTLAAEIERLGHSSLSSAGPGPSVVVEASAQPTLYTSILTQDRDTIVNTVNMAHQLIQQTGDHLTRILETLSFQDLSGQRIMKVVGLLGDVQMQLLSILVSVNAKIKVHQASGQEDLSSGQAEEMAQEEVDKALEKMAGGSTLLGPGAETRLDQGAVNDLLAQLGF